MSIINNQGKRREIVDLLTWAYSMEIETVMNYTNCRFSTSNSPPDS